MKGYAFTDQELKNAARLLRNSMLDSLPKNSEGEFSKQFEERMSSLMAVRKKREVRLRYAKRIAAAAAAFILVISMFLFMNTEVRAAVKAWVKEIFETHAAYWFIGEMPDVLPEYELTAVPEQYQCILDETIHNARAMVYVNPEDELDGFTFDYGFVQEELPLIVDYAGIEVTIQDVTINGCPGKLYISAEPDECHALVWIDEARQVILSMTSYLEPEVMLHIAKSVKLVK